MVRRFSPLSFWQRRARNELRHQRRISANSSDISGVSINNPDCGHGCFGDSGVFLETLEEGEEERDRFRDGTHVPGV